MSPSEEAELAAELRRIKDRAGLTLSQLATRTWYSRSSLDRYMNGKVFPPRGVVEAISDSCGADTDAIIAVWERAWSRRRDRSRGADAGTAPMELPADLPDFTGRRAYRAAIEAQLLEDGSVAPAVAVISGMAGAGKTALAVHIAHRLRADYPDGQLYLHLAGMSARPMKPRAALGQLLRSLGVEGAGLPDGVAERAALYRSRLASRRMLVVADDAASAEQVRPLIPGTATSSLIVTSRTRLAELAGARLHQLEPFRPDEALELLSELVGAHRVAADPELAARIVSWCGNLPLAIRIAGARLAGGLRPELRDLAAGLADERHRLTELAVGDLAVRSNLERSFLALRDVQRTVLTRLATLETTPYASWMIAPLAGCGAVEAELLTDQLIAANLLAHNGSDGAGHRRIVLHDLVRDYAREQAERDPPEDRDAATGRLLGACLDLIERAEESFGQRYFPPPRLSAPRWRPADAPDERFDHPHWYAANRRSLVAAVGLACDTGRVPTASAMAALLSSFCAAHSDWSAWRTTHETVLAASAADPYALRGLAELELIRDRFAEAFELFNDAGDQLTALGDRESAAYVLVLQGVIKRRMLDPRSAARSYAKASRMFEELDNDRGRGHVALGWGIQQMYRHRWLQAVQQFGHALELLDATGDARGVAWTQYWLGAAHRMLRNVAEGRAWLDRAEKGFEALWDRASAALCLRERAELLRQEGQLDRATALLVRSLAVARELGERGQEVVAMHGLGTVIGETDASQGVAVLSRAVDMAREQDDAFLVKRISGDLDELRRRTLAGEGER